MFKNPNIKHIASALAVAVFGFILLNVAFLFDFLIHSLVGGIIRLFITVNPEMDYWYPPMMHVLFVVIIGLFSRLVFKSKFHTLYKAIYMTVPLAVVYVTFGIFLYRWPPAAYTLGSLFCISIFYYFYRTKQPWLYYYTVILVSFTMLLVGLFGIEI